MSDSGLYTARPRSWVLDDIVRRTSERWSTLDDDDLAEELEDALYQERLRLKGRGGTDGDAALLEPLARALVRGDRRRREEAGKALVRHWAEEVHGTFSPRMYNFSTRVLPRMLQGLLTGRGRGGAELEHDWPRRLRVEGDVGLLRELCKESTLILAPTHVSNLDSPLIGLALYQAGLPPFVYGAGLNLFSNPVMGFFMSRLGAYTVDRTKRARLYKQVLKDYSVRCLATRHHSLFFPGGTRSRSGAIETGLKKGLLGTGVVAWQEMLRRGRPDCDVYVVPLTLSFQLTLEASTLAADYLADAGKQRFIITDDEFAQPRRIWSFARRVLELDASVIAHFGAPLDVLGNPVPELAEDRRDASRERRAYVCDRSGQVTTDDQRDRVYTARLADRIVQAYPRGAWVMDTHLVAWAAWTALGRRLGTRDTFRLLRIPRDGRVIDRAAFREILAEGHARVTKLASDGHCHLALSTDLDGIMATAVERFGRYHRSAAVRPHPDGWFVEDPQLAMYYRNRLEWARLES